MTIVIADDATAPFKDAVLRALREICPCDRVTLSGGSRVVITRGSDCRCLCDHPAGCNLLRHLDGWAETVEIDKSVGSTSTYNTDSNLVSWDSDADKMSDDHDICGGMATSPAVVLAHELIHARHDQLQTLAGDQEEFLTVRGENQIRLELCWPPRIEYADPVPDYHVPNIDDSSPAPCDCGASKMSFFPLTRHWRCAKVKDRCHDPVTAAANLFELVIGGRRPARKAFFAMQEMSGFEAMLRGADDRLAEIVRFALRRRATSGDRERAIRLREAVLAADRGWVLEAVDLGGRHRVIAVRTDPTRLPDAILDTNLAPVEGFTPGQQTLFVGSVGEFTTSPVADGENRLPGLPAFEAGVGGNTAVYDGTAHFLTVKDRDEVRETVLYGYALPAYNAHWEEPPGEDLGRWQALNRAYEMWRDALAGSD